jgi:outer membrane receptor for ferrienterochelin and colicins
MVDLTDQLTADPGDDDTTTMNGFFGRTVYNHNFSEKFVLLTGVDVNYEGAKGKKIDNSTHSMTDVAAYASLDYKPIENLTLRPSLRGIYNSQFNAPLVPSLNVLFKACNTLSVRASWSKGFRAPSIKEQYLYFVDISHNVRGNSDLIAEKSDNYNLSLEFKKAFGKRVFSVEPGVFYNNIFDQISLVEADANTALYTYVNLDEFISKGGDVKARFVTERFQITGGAAYTGTWSTYEGDLEQPETAWYSEFNSSADYKFTKLNFTVSAYWRYIGEKPVYLLDGSNGLVRTMNQSYQLVDFSVRKPFLKNHVTLTTGVKNIMDVTNVRSAVSGGAHSGGNDGTTAIGMGRSYFVKLILSL